MDWEKSIQEDIMSLSYNPSNQGLKLKLGNLLFNYLLVFILQSIKPRVETMLPEIKPLKAQESLSYNPSNQGLKHINGDHKRCDIRVFILQSIKPRVETCFPVGRHH